VRNIPGIPNTAGRGGTHPIDRQLTRYLRRQPGSSRRGVPGPIKSQRAPKTVSKQKFLALRAQGKVSVQPRDYRVAALAAQRRNTPAIGVKGLLRGLDTAAGYALGGVRPSRMPHNALMGAESFVPGTGEWKRNHPAQAPTWAEAKPNIAMYPLGGKLKRPLTWLTGGDRMDNPPLERALNMFVGAEAVGGTAGTVWAVKKMHDAASYTGPGKPPKPPKPTGGLLSNNEVARISQSNQRVRNALYKDLRTLGRQGANIDVPTAIRRLNSAEFASVRDAYVNLQQTHKPPAGGWSWTP